MKDLIPLMEEGGSAPQLLNLNQFSISGKKMTLKDAQAQLAKMKRLANLKAEQEKTKKKSNKLSPAEIQAQAQKLVEYGAKRKRMLEEYNHCISYRADELPILKISYKINKVAKDATMRIERNNQPLTLTVYEKIMLKQLGLSEWIKIYAMAYKVKSNSNDLLLKNLKAKFEWIKTQAEKLGIPLPPELSPVGLFAAEKKRKRSSEIIKEVFVKDNIVVDGIQRNLIPPPGVEGTRGLVIREPELGIFFYNGNFDLVFQREEEFHLATTAQLIKLQNSIQRGSPKAEEMFTKLELTIEARNDVTKARKVVSAGREGLAECNASASNFIRIQVKYIVKKVKDYLKTYSSAGMDISCCQLSGEEALRGVRVEVDRKDYMRR
ncbi:hypothetical protein Tco_0887584 [Tanacetum coccineum]